MKRIALLLVVFCLGLLAASFAFADDGGGKKGRDGSASTSTSSTDEGKGDKKKCHNVSLKGTAPATTFTITVDRANKAGRDLKSATLTFSGKVNVNAVMCSSDSSGAGGSASSLKLRNLKVGKAASEGSGD
jgi:hypothetical protein